MKKDEKYYMEYDLKSLTKKGLLNDPSLGFGLARYNKKFGEHPLAQDLDVLKDVKSSVAHMLAIYGNGWARTQAAQKLEVLKLSGGFISRKRDFGFGIEGLIGCNCIIDVNDGLVAYELAANSENNGWGMTPAAQNLEVLRLCGGEVIYNLVKKSKKNGWRKSFMGMVLYYFVLFKSGVLKNLNDVLYKFSGIRV